MAQSSALKWISREAKAIRKRHPRKHRKWTQYIKEASIKYKQKHKRSEPKRVGRAIGRGGGHIPTKASTPRRRFDKIQQVTGVPKNYIQAIGSVSSSLSVIRRRIESDIANLEVRRFKAKTKTAKRKIAKRITEKKKQYRKFS